MFKVISVLIELGILGYLMYLGLFKEAPTLHDVAFMGVMIYVNTLINQGKLERIEKKRNG